MHIGLIPELFSMDCWRLIYKHHRILLILLVGPRGGKAHWFNPWPLFGGSLVVINYKYKKYELVVIMSNNIYS